MQAINSSQNVRGCKNTPVSLPSLRLALLNEAKEVRAAGLRALRYLMKDSSVLQRILRLQVDYLISR